MAKTVTLASMRSQAQKRADMENSNFLSIGEWNENINASATELYDLLTTVYSDYYFQTSALTTDGVNDSYPLPSDFYKLLGVDQVISAATGDAISLDLFNFAERNRFTKLTSAGLAINLHYIPAMPALVNDTDTFDGINGWEEYIVIDSAIKALTKEESDTTKLERDKANLAARIQASAPNRDAGSKDRVTDVTRMEQAYAASLPSSLRYRVLGSSIKFVTSLMPAAPGQ